MDIKNITGSLFTDWRWLLQRCQTDVSASKSYLQDVKRKKARVTHMVGQCGQGCRSQHFVETSQWMSGRREWKPTSHNRGTVPHTTIQSYRSTDANQARGLQKSQESFTQRDISSLWTSPKAKSQTVQHNTNRVMSWC